MTFDSKEELSTNNACSDLIIMDTQTGGWKYVFGINNNSDYKRTINDLTFRVYSRYPN
jgi:hypothetical protein